MKRIAIVGGGPGGLFTARLLSEKLNDRIEITLFEAAPRLGGKVVTGCFKKSGIAFEAGTAELYDYSMHGPDPLRDLVQQLGLETMPFQGGAVVLGDRILRGPDDIRRAYGARTLSAIRAFHRRCAEILSPEDYYNEGSGNEDNASALSAMTFEELLRQVPDEAARHYLLTAVRSDIATEPIATNALNGIKNVLMDDRAYMKLYAIVGRARAADCKAGGEPRGENSAAPPSQRDLPLGQELSRAHKRTALPVRCSGAGDAVLPPEPLGVRRWRSASRAQRALQVLRSTWSLPARDRAFPHSLLAPQSERQLLHDRRVRRGLCL